MSVLGVLNFGEAALLVAIVEIASFIGLALSVTASVLGLKAKKEARSVGGIICGCVAAVVGAIVVCISDRPLPSFERRAFYFAFVAILVGIIGAFLSSRKNEKRA